MHTEVRRVSCAVLMCGTKTCRVSLTRARICFGSSASWGESRGRHTSSKTKRPTCECVGGYA
eukprot:1922285-Rhodomonas_salina.2